ncbi:BTAD domain-containing putative transcriptional regulator [Streptomyces sp. B6B3]|uniref:AfsR/SARP family transcriptional regulator n=1 Tax=Streptomyces sp. B6B3 TaxID=3153570 RepID=UPI00325EE24D
MEIRIGGVRQHLPGPRQLRLLAMLLLHPHRVVTTQELVDALWDDAPPDTARRQVHNAIATLRREFGPARALVVTDGPGYRVEIAEEQIDAHRFNRAVETALRHREAARERAAVETMAEALALWRGPALAGLTGKAIEAMASRLDEQLLAAQELSFELRLAVGEAAGLVPELTELVAHHPLREGLAGHLMLALHRSGRQPDALEVYQRARRRLDEELGIEPGPALRALHLRVLRNVPEPPPRSATPHGTLGLAQDRAGDLGGDQPVSDLPHTVEPAQLSHLARRAPRHPRALPRDLADFMGRTSELSRLLAVAGESGRTALLITALDGMAGIGKTTLAVRVAHLIANQYPDGQLFVDLHGHTPGRSPLSTAAALQLLLLGLGVPPEEIPSDPEERADRWRSETATRRMLLLLDNASDAAQVRALVPGSPGSGVVITSRRRLVSLDGVTSLSLDLMARADAVDLFRRVAGVRRTEPEAEYVDEVVELCGLLPLAVRIAASRLHHRPAWTVAYLAQRLRDEQRRLSELSAGDRSVRTAFSVSYGHLPAEQQRLFRLLALHAGTDFDAHDTAALLAAPVHQAERLLEALLDGHLLAQRVPGRYHFHDLVLHHARDTVCREEPATKREAAVRRLSQHYLDLGYAVEQLVDPGRQLIAPGPRHRSELPPLRTMADAKAVVAATHHNFLPVIESAHAHGLLQLTWQLAAVLSSCLLRQGDVDQALAGYELGLGAARAADSAEGEATIHRSLGFGYIGAGRFADALRTLRDGLALERERGTDLGAGRILNNLAIVHIRLGQPSDALAILLQARDLIWHAGSARDQAILLGNLGVAYTYLGEYDQAVATYLEMLGLAQRMRNRHAELLALTNLGWACTEQGELRSALRHLRQGLELNRDVGSKELEARGRAYLADCLRRDGDTAQALVECRAALALAREMASADIEALALNVLGNIHAAGNDPAAAETCFRRVLEITERNGLAFRATRARQGLDRIRASSGL